MGAAGLRFRLKTITSALFHKKTTLDAGIGKFNGSMSWDPSTAYACELTTILRKFKNDHWR
jgi:hypothetical protein